MKYKSLKIKGIHLSLTIDFEGTDGHLYSVIGTNSLDKGGWSYYIEGHNGIRVSNNNKRLWDEAEKIFTSEAKRIGILKW